MPISILMPALSPTMTEGNLVKWLKKEGDKVQPGEVIAEIETDKATMEVESVDEGVLAKIFVPEGTEGVKVNTLIAALLEEGENATALETLQSTAVQQETVVAPANAAEPTPTLSPSSIQATTPQSVGDRIIASPLAKRMAEQAGLDLRVIQGSGPQGRIVKNDVLVAVAQGNVSPNIILTSVAPSIAQASQSLSHPAPQAKSLPLTGMRKTIAKRLTESKQQIPHFYLQVDCRMDSLLKVRGDINKSLEKQGIKVSVNDMIIKACGLALRKVPEANCTWGQDVVHQLPSYDVAVAVAIEGGLITPIVTHADQRGLADISMTMKDLVQRAQSGQLKPQEYQGGAFSLSNLGMYGIESFQAIINPPQASILAVGASSEKPIMENGSITVGQVMSCTLSVDHRILDGAVAARFLRAIQEFIENPSLMLI